MQNYLNLLNQVLETGHQRTNRTGIDTLSLFGAQIRFDLQEGFPLVTTKKIHLKSIIYELLWFLSGSTNVEFLKNHGVKIWDEWATAEQCDKFDRAVGELGPIYGHQWRNFGATKTSIECFMCYGTGSKFTKNPNNICPVCDGTGELKEFQRRYQSDGVDQIKHAIDLINTNPNSRRIIVTGWNPAECDMVALPPCHTLFQFYVHDDRLSCQLYQRSADLFLGVPFNIASYALLTMMVAQVCDLRVGEFIHTFGDVHLYLNHIDQAKLQLEREPKVLPQIKLNPVVKDIFAFKYEDVELIGYDPYPRIKAAVAV